MIPEDLLYSEEHEWIRLEDDVAIIGITDFAQDQLGDIVYVDLPADGETVSAGTVIGELESTKSVSDIFCPVDGTIVARNDGLEDAPEVINTDPYGEGWLIKVRVDGEDPTAGLIDAAGYAKVTSA